ncbi:ubiquinone anaerobic biosynthesis accessory factor UbiT [Denitrobaculum tricleocarpae]|uniref:SCP2 domain-containing protein n=1 Tax=Denitrobaculum tricleocarpae TaxID=2591009 RepID=A0A545TRF3_9PROT|nr:SCP2 sterol-binding domain-containing protein [Denitrobaculum tricleocarpae]TQV79805.1 hypothetical protein FKG95_13990 [Denitrobaculum tricleocarpae]
MLDFRSPPPLSGALVAGLPLRLLPTPPLAWFLQQTADAFCRLHPGVPERLTDYAGRHLLLDPSDLPVAFILTLTDSTPRIAAVGQDRQVPEAPDASVRGALADLTALLEGEVDGDALFFSRHLQITGDMELVLALRNALDDARVDLRRIIGESFGHAAPLARAALDAALGGYTRLDRGVSLLGRAVTAVTQERLDRQSSEIEKLRAEVRELRTQRRRPATQRQREDIS